MIVKMSFEPRKRSQKRSKALRKASRTIQSLEEKVSKLTRENKKLRKRHERAIKANQKALRSTSIQNKQAVSTPKSKANREIRELGLTPRKVPTKIKRKLIMANAMIAEVQSSQKKNKTQKKRRVVANIVSGNIIRKYRCLDLMSRETGIARSVLKNAKSKRLIAVSRRRKVLERERIKKRVISFMERDNVSVNMPGKNDCKKTEVKGEKQQVRVLTDYLSNIYEKFTGENPGIRVSKSVFFCRLRPNHILLTKLITRNTCLCSKHQNFAMKLKCLRSLGIEISPNPETVSRKVTEEDLKKMIAGNLLSDDDIENEEWKRVDVDGKKRMKIVKVKLQKDDFKLQMEQQYKEFLQHVSRVKTQYTAIRELKADLPKNEILVHMEFAENFTCSNADEVQSAYWNSTAVKLHPVVVYYRKEELEHRNFIFVSDVTNHNSTAVYTILKKLVPELKSLLPDLKVVHYWTDSPFSQYRNKYIFDIVQHHVDLFNVQARWNYFESGHGKGPCDGLGGIAKRQAAEACKQGKVNIQDAIDFFQWAKTQRKSIEYIFYTRSEYEETAKELETRNPKTIPGTMKLHAVFPVEQTLYTREVSCYCKTCLTGEPCEQWKAVLTPPTELQNSSDRNRKKRRSDETEDENTDRIKVMRTSQSDPVQVDQSKSEKERTSICGPTIDSYALVKWDEALYPAKIIEVNESKQDVKVSFMEEASRKGGHPLFKWPTKPDIQYVDFDQIIRRIEEPKASSKSRRQFKLDENDYNYLDSDSD